MGRQDALILTSFHYEFFKHLSFWQRTSQTSTIEKETSMLAIPTNITQPLSEFPSEETTVRIGMLAIMIGSVRGEVFYIVISQRDRRIYPLYTITDPLYARFKCSKQIGKPSGPEFSSVIDGYPLYTHPLYARSTVAATRNSVFSSKFKEITWVR